jgi:hypothetical protein
MDVSVQVSMFARPEVEPLPLPVCAARHKLASRREEASYIFFIPNTSNAFLRDNFT